MSDTTVENECVPRGVCTSTTTRLPPLGALHFRGRCRFVCQYLADAGEEVLEVSDGHSR
jgi:hypothetical protein